MSKYDFNNIEFSNSVNNIKSALYDVISSINGKIFNLEDGNNQKEVLQAELKKLIDLQDKIEKSVYSVDKLLSGDDIVIEKEEVEINTEDNTDNEINLDNKQFVPDQISADEEVELSDKAINDLYKDTGDSEENKEETNQIDVGDSGLKLPGLDSTTVEETPKEESEKTESTDAPEEPKIEETQEVQTDTPEIETEVKEETPEVKEETVQEEKPTLETEPVEEKKPDVMYMVSKTSNDPSKAIIVTNSQFQKLLESHDKQRSLSKFRNLFKLDNVQHDDINLEEMMNKANELYKAGDTKGAEELYNKISEINESRNS